MYKGFLKEFCLYFIVKVMLVFFSGCVIDNGEKLDVIKYMENIDN